jgi:hypothetical protein
MNRGRAGRAGLSRRNEVKAACRVEAQHRRKLTLTDFPRKIAAWARFTPATFSSKSLNCCSMQCFAKTLIRRFNSVTIT